MNYTAAAHVDILARGAVTFNDLRALYFESTLTSFKCRMDETLEVEEKYATCTAELKKDSELKTTQDTISTQDGESEIDPSKSKENKDMTEVCVMNSSIANASSSCQSNARKKYCNDFFSEGITPQEFLLSEGTMQHELLKTSVFQAIQTQ